MHASPMCEKFVRNYVTVPVRNRVTKTTAEAWAKWRVGHPNWKPPLHASRPRYLLTRKETVHEVPVACEVPTTPDSTDMLLTPADLTPPPPDTALPPEETAKVIFPGMIPPITAPPPPPATSTGTGIYVPPFVPPIYGSTPPTGQTSTPPCGPITTTASVPPAVTPEPSSFALLATGMATAGAMWRRCRAVRQA